MIDEKTRRLLVVDDEVDLLNSLCDLLIKEGYEVEGYTSGKNALDAMKEKNFDLLLSDLSMPEMDGIKLLQEALKIDPLLICIIITGRGTIPSAVEAMKIGAFDYILKPLDWQLLKPVLSRAIKVHDLRKSEEKYRSIVEDYQTELIFRWQIDGKITFANEVFCRYFEKTHKELIGNSFFLLIPRNDYEKLKKYTTALTPQNPAVTIEHRVINPRGNPRWHQWTYRAIFNQQYKIIEFQSVGRDITERKQAEEKLEKSLEQLRAFATHLTEVEEIERRRLSQELHDRVGQNLTALGVNLNLMHLDVPQDMAGKLIPRINDSFDLLQTIAKNIRDVMADLSPSMLNDHGLLAAIRWYSEKFSNRTGIPITIEEKELTPRLPQSVEIAMFRITQEALTNITKHAQATKITITLKKMDGIIQLAIIDNGVGFDPAVIHKTEEESGSGLLIMKERAAAMGGKLRVESEQGKGTTVIVEFKS
ncbi:MAG: response regulator [Nitrospirota bacterium]